MQLSNRSSLMRMTLHLSHSVSPQRLYERIYSWPCRNWSRHSLHDPPLAICTWSCTDPSRIDLWLWARISFGGVLSSISTYVVVICHLCDAQIGRWPGMLLTDARAGLSWALWIVGESYLHIYIYIQRQKCYGINIPKQRCLLGRK